MRFSVSFEGRRRSVDLVFGKPMDMPALMRWRTSTTQRKDPHVRDAMEFRKLATKRWRYYIKGNQAVTSFGELQRAVLDNPSAEVGFLLMAKAPWHRTTTVLGCCFTRRSWCHHEMRRLADCNRIRQLDRMKRAKPLRTLEELWDLEDKHPLADASTGGLLRWMYATGMLAGPTPAHVARKRRNGGSSRQGKTAGH